MPLPQSDHELTKPLPCRENINVANILSVLIVLVKNKNERILYVEGLTARNAMSPAV